MPDTPPDPADRAIRCLMDIRTETVRTMGEFGFMRSTPTDRRTFLWRQ